MMWLLVVASGAAAFVAEPFRGSVRLGASSAPSEEAWQEVFEKAVLDVRTGPRERIEALASLASRVEDVARDVQEATMSRDVTALFAPKDREAVRAVQRQVREDLIPALRSTKPREAASKLGEVVNQAIQQPIQPSSVDLGRLADDLAEEISNVYATPSLEQPSFAIVGGLGDDVEVRTYEAYVAATTPMTGESVTEEAGFSSGVEFGKLAGYVFGQNDRGERIGMTTPVEIDFVDGIATSMAFSLPRRYGTAVDAPLADAVALENRQPFKCAALTFPGLATTGEVRRALARIRTAIDESPDYVARDDTYKLLQFNPPYTLPWRRTNTLLVALDENIDNESITCADVRECTPFYDPG
ncbi:hypothetical protein CTAYLR_009117 [Chrysophaeum taylorii]|uniref:Uncharacterized protein n=1 Tax=Chrysophaeum taylorii TaxID=2483200 RepID=A0AAD7UL73_9STRA|nr:hypothetical protein CTAYLR_009117 [Chrysophaeum taylorii]